jgi:hypothetical protein
MDPPASDARAELYLERGASLSDQDQLLPPFERELLANYPWLVVVALVVTNPVIVAAQQDVGPMNQDWLFVSGILLFFVAYPLSLLLPYRAALAFRTLEPVVASSSAPAVRTLVTKLHEDARRWANMWGVLLAAIMVVAWFVALNIHVLRIAQVVALPFVVPGALLEAVLAAAVGRFFGRVLCYGTLARRLRRSGLSVVATAGHPDGLGGLRPVGRFYVEAALLVGLVAAFLDVWLLVMPVFGDAYSGWRGPYAALLMFTLACAGAVVLVPLAAFRRLLRGHCRDRLGARARPASEAMPASIIDARLLRRLALGYAVMAAPLMTVIPGVGSLVGIS